MTLVCQGASSLVSGAVHIACDSTSALRCLDKSWHFTATKSDYDLLVVVQHMVRQTAVMVHAHHVKGHQDDTGKQLNCWENGTLIWTCWQRWPGCRPLNRALTGGQRPE